MRIKIFEFWKAWQRRRVLKTFAAELEKNLEICYVSKQLGQLQVFSLAAWEKVCLLNITWPVEILRYVEKIKEYNAAFYNAQQYERWYLADIARQQQETAQILHDRKESAQQTFIGVEQSIKAAQGVL